MDMTSKEMIVELEDDDEGTGPDELIPVLRGAAALALTSLEGLRLLTAERTTDKLPGKMLPPVLPLELAELSPADFVTFTSAHMTHNEKHCSAGSVGDVVSSETWSLSTDNCGG